MTRPMRRYETLPRLYIDAPIRPGEEIDLLQAQAHYLGTVMRLRKGGQVRIFNADAGEYLADITDISKRAGMIIPVERLRPPYKTPDIWLLFAPVKKARTDFIVEKATELGARLIRPVITLRTTKPNVRLDRMKTQAIEAAEQTERMDIPTIADPVGLIELLADWDPDRKLIFADEAGDAPPAIEAMGAIDAPAAILIGPEGGFDPTERKMLRSKPFVVPVSLGPRILRADTAAAATLALWQAVSGDWS